MRSELGRIWPTAKSAGVIGAPHGANYDAYATLTGPTLRANLPPRRGGATIPYIYKGIVRSYNNFAGGTKVEFLPPSGEKTFEFLGPLSPRRGVEVAYP